MMNTVDRAARSEKMRGGIETTMFLAFFLHLHNSVKICHNCLIRTSQARHGVDFRIHNEQCKEANVASTRRFQNRAFFSETVADTQEPGKCQCSHHVGAPGKQTRAGGGMNHARQGRLPASDTWTGGVTSRERGAVPASQPAVGRGTDRRQAMTSTPQASLP